MAGVQGPSVAAVTGPRGCRTAATAAGGVGARRRKMLFCNPLFLPNVPSWLFSPVCPAGGKYWTSLTTADVSGGQGAWA